MKDNILGDVVNLVHAVTSGKQYLSRKHIRAFCTAKHQMFGTSLLEVLQKR
jgi:hypothetical protein